MHKAMLIFASAFFLCGAPPAHAQDAPAAAQNEQPAPDARPKAIEYSDAYETRAKIH
jgi:hypothetical protein